MIPKECKRLAEVDFPIAVVSKHSAREKSIRHGHPSTLHLWWARRPLAACRAILLGLLLPDPCDPLCPADFKHKARKLLSQVPGSVGSSDEELRQAILRFIGDFANWDLSNDRTYLEVSRGLVKAAHPEETPLVVDPFAGGGSIPLEALRIGCDAFASDLNPVACLILKVMLEDIPRHGPALAEELQKIGQQIKEETEKELAEFYPPDPDGSRPIAYLWARTIQCEAPNCGAEIPLVRSLWLSKKVGRKRALRYKVVRPSESTPHVEFEIFETKADNEVPEGTVKRAKVTCICCNTVLSPERVRAQLTKQHGGADVIFNEQGIRKGGARLLAVVMVKPGEQGRNYRLSKEQDYKEIWNAQQKLAVISSVILENGLNPIPNELIDQWHHDVNRMPMYGMTKWGDIFSSRQKLALLLFSSVIRLHRKEKMRSMNSLTEIVAFALSKRADYGSSGTKWHLTFEKTTCTFGRQALPITWDFVEPSPIGNTSGSYGAGLEAVISAAMTVSQISRYPGQVQLSDAYESPLPNNSCSVWFTDPPYYDAIDYAHCSDFFYVWLKRALIEHPFMQDIYDSSNPLTPKKQEIVVDSTTTKGHGIRTPAFYESSMGHAFKEGRRILKDDSIGCVVFAHKTTEGWEALLSGMIKGGWTITGSWPIVTERPGRLRSQDSAALATSVHLVCRPRAEDAPIGDWIDVQRELPKRVKDWMERLQNEGVRGADLVFACIGPALEIFSKYSKVVDPQEREIPLGGYPEASEPYKRGFLTYVWEIIGRSALEQVLGTARNGVVGTIEEDARLTALFLWTLQSTNGNDTPSPLPSPTRGEGTSGKSPTMGEGNISAENEDDTSEDEEAETPKGKQKGFNLIFDVVRRFAQPLGIHLPEWEGRIIETKKGIVRLLSVEERAKQLFGEDGAQAVADQLEKDTSKNLQGILFPVSSEDAASPIVRGKRRQRKSRVDISKEAFETKWEATTLDRIHAAMLLQASGKANALRSLLKTEQERGSEFLRLANALSALYPKSSEEKRLLDAMLLAVPR